VYHFDDTIQIKDATEKGIRVISDIM